MQRATLTVLSLVLIAGSGQAEDVVRWAGEFRQATERAARERKLVLLHFESDNCPPCRKLAANVFNRDDVAAAIAADFVAVKINVDRNPEMARRYSVSSWPQDVVVTPMGQELYRQVSPQKPADYIARLKEIVARSGSAMARSNSTMPARDATGTTQPVDFQSQGTRGKADPADLSAEFESPMIDNGAPTPDEEIKPAIPQQNEYVAAPPAVVESGTEYQGIEPVAPRQSSDPVAAPANATKPPQARAQIGTYSSQPPSSQPPRESASPATPPAAKSVAPILPPIGMEGYCVVTLHQFNTKVAEAQAAGASLDPSVKGWVKGSKKCGVIHRGRLYLFAHAEAQKAFLADPDRFAPALSGYDPVLFNETQNLVEGKRAYGLSFNGQVYIFASEQSLRKFEAEPKPFADTVYQAMLRSDKASTLR